MTDAIQTAVDGYFATVGAEDTDAFVELFAEDVVFQDPVGTPTLTGPEGVRKFHIRLQKSWQSLEMTPRATFPRGGRAAVYWTAEGLSGTGKAIRFAGVDVFEVDDAGRIRRVEGYWPIEEVIAQM
jgi:steroid delta-isomerase